MFRYLPVRLEKYQSMPRGVKYDNREKNKREIVKRKIKGKSKEKEYNISTQKGGNEVKIGKERKPTYVFEGKKIFLHAVLRSKLIFWIRNRTWIRHFSKAY